jgi:hypothetical protein
VGLISEYIRERRLIHMYKERQRWSHRVAR